MEVLLYFVPIISIILLVICISFYKKKDPTNGMRELVGKHAYVLEPLDKYSGSAIVFGEGIVVKCITYFGEIEEDKTILLTEYDELNKIFKAELSPRYYYETEETRN